MENSLLFNKFAVITDNLLTNEEAIVTLKMTFFFLLISTNFIIKMPFFFMKN